MNCDTARELIGAYADGELAMEQSGVLREHLASCADCAAELRSLNHLSDRLSRSEASSHVHAPSSLWQAIEERLSAPPASRHRSVRPGSRLFRRPLALAASLALFLGAGVLFTTALDRSSPPAIAATIDYSVLMDRVASDAGSAIDRFLTHYRAEAIERTEARTASPHLSFDLPEKLPSGHKFLQAYKFRLGQSNAIAATYDRDGTPLFLIFHPARDNMKGPAGTMCKIGDLRAGQIEAGAWSLVHVMDDTTCHCVLSTLDDAALEPVVLAVAPALRAGMTPHHAH